jgi:hypothetical protein
MLNFFRKHSQQHTTTQVLPETVLEDEALPDGVPAEGKIIVTIASQFGSGGSEVGRIVASERVRAAVPRSPDYR